MNHILNQLIAWLLEKPIRIVIFCGVFYLSL